MQAIWNNQVIADSNQTMIIEGNHYFPLASVEATMLKPSATHTTCPWKGEASYYDVVVDGKTNKDAAWYYHQPKKTAIEAVGDFTDYVAFWNGVEVK